MAKTNHIGRCFETQLNDSIRRLYGFAHAKIPDVINPKMMGGGALSWKDRVQRPCDFVVPLPNGRCMWIEAKATTGFRIPLERFKEHQWEVFVKLSRMGQCAWVLCMYEREPTMEKPQALRECWGISAAQMVGIRYAEKSPTTVTVGWCRENAVSVPRTVVNGGAVWDLRVLENSDEAQALHTA